jgi:hypothetical protein
MLTAIESELRKTIHRKCAPGTRAGRHVADIADRMSRGYYTPELLHLFVHKRGGRYNLADAYGFTLFLANWFTGALAFTKVRVFREQDALGGFRASEPFYMALESDGGRFGWRVPVGLQLNFDGGRKAGVRHESVEVRPRELPLLTGFTTGARTMAHLFERGGFVRWPIGDEWAMVVIKTPEDAPRGPVGFGNWPHCEVFAG